MDHLINLLKDEKLRPIFKLNAKLCEQDYVPGGAVYKNRPWNYQGLVWTFKPWNGELSIHPHSACYGTLNSWRRLLKFHFFTTPIFQHTTLNSHEWTWNIFFVPESPFRMWIDKMLEVQFVPGTTREQLFEFVKAYGWTYTPELLKTFDFPLWSNFMYATRLGWEKDEASMKRLLEQHKFSHIDAFFFRTFLQWRSDYWIQSGHYGHWWIFPNEQAYGRYIKGTPDLDTSKLFQDEAIWGSLRSIPLKKWDEPMPTRDYKDYAGRIIKREELIPERVLEHFKKYAEVA